MLFLCVCISTVHMWRSESSLQELVLSVHHVGQGNWILVIRLGSKRLYPVNWLVSTKKVILKISRAWWHLSLDVLWEKLWMEDARLFRFYKRGRWLSKSLSCMTVSVPWWWRVWSEMLHHQGTVGNWLVWSTYCMQTWTGLRRGPSVCWSM